MSTYILSLNFTKNAELMNYKSLGVSRMNAWRLLSRPEFCNSPVMDYCKMLWEDKTDLLMAYFRSLEVEWRKRKYTSNLPLEAFENHEEYDIPEEWKHPEFVDSHRNMHNIIYRGYFITSLKLTTDVEVGFLNPYLFSQGTIEYSEVPEFIQFPKYCRGLFYSETYCEEDENHPDRCNLLLKPGQEFCNHHDRIINKTKRCAHVLKKGYGKCFKRCTLGETFCTVHRKYKEDSGKDICNFKSEDEKCIRHTTENSEFCRLHGGKPKKTVKSKAASKAKGNTKAKAGPKEKGSAKAAKKDDKGKEPSSSKDEYMAESETIEKFEIENYEIKRFQETEKEIKIIYRKL